ncbi:MAG TPA: DNA polymerase III subunit gamma/tau [Usitatibacteraceae bacterium]|nr:DNA polymerase III subunit gamma/tau [Usitatibacteraceae bacterium]
MTYQVLARKWRPKAFEQLVGQPHVVTALANALDTGRLHHAYLFTGTRGVGKTTLARILAKAINCETGVSSRPCGKCRACTEIDSGRFVDMLEVDAATNTKVDEMRELLDNAQYMPVSGRYKVYIIDEVHMLSRHAFNSMLKTLEEPPEHVKFILATTDPQRLPVTVLSRCLQFNLKALPPLALAGHLKRVLEAEGIPFEDQALALLARAAAGSVRDSLSLADQAIAFGSGKVTAAQVSDMLGAVGGDLVWPLLENIAAADGAGALAEAERISERGLSCDQALQDVAAVLHRVALVQNGAQLPPDDPDSARIASLASRLDAGRVQVMYQVAVLGRRDLPLAPDEIAGFGMAVMRMLSFGTASAAEPVSARGAPVAAPSYGAAGPLAGALREPQPPAVAAAPAYAPAAPTSIATGAMTAFDGDWTAFVERQSLSGMAGLLARYGEMDSFDDNHLRLVLPEAHRMYAEKSYQDKLKAELAPQFGAGFRLSVRVGETRGRSVAAVRGVEAQQRIDGATAALESDPFVRDLVEGMGAQVVASSIRPAGEKDSGSTENRRSKP